MADNSVRLRSEGTDATSSEAGGSCPVVSKIADLGQAFIAAARSTAGTVRPNCLWRSLVIG